MVGTKVYALIRSHNSDKPGEVQQVRVGMKQEFPSCLGLFIQRRKPHTGLVVLMVFKSHAKTTM